MAERLKVSLRGLKLDTDNNPPVANPQSLQTDYETPVDITLTASDPNPGDTLTFSIVVDPDWGTITGIPPNITYTPDDLFSGFDSFVFEVSDGAATSRATVSVEVLAKLFGLEDLTGLQLLYEPAYEGGNAPSGIADRSQNPTIVNGGEFDLFSDYSGLNRHGAYSGISAKAIWEENNITDALFDLRGGPYDTGNAVDGFPDVDQVFTWIAVFKYNGDTGNYLSCNTQFPSIRVTSGMLEYVQDDSLDFPRVQLLAALDNDPHIIQVAQDANGVEVRFDGEVKFFSNLPGPSYGEQLKKIAGTATNGARLICKSGPIAVSSVRQSQVNIIKAEQLLAGRYGVTIGGAVQIDLMENAVFQRQSTGGGIIRAKGDYVTPLVTAVKARFNGGAWQPATLDVPNNRWSIELATTDEVWGLLEVASDDESFIASTTVGVGDVALVFGQSNAGRITGVSGQPAYGLATPTSVYDTINYSERWGNPVDKHWLTRFLVRAVPDSSPVPFGMVRVSVGSTSISQWLKGEPGTNYTLIEQALLGAQNIEGPYVPATHGVLCVRALVQFGERDSQLNTGQSGVRDDVEAISADLNADFDLDAIYWSNLQNLHPDYAAVAAQQAYRDGVSDAIANQPYILPGADLQAITTAQLWSGTNGVHPGTVAELDEEGDAWADALSIP